MQLGREHDLNEMDSSRRQGTKTNRILALQKGCCAGFQDSFISVTENHESEPLSLPDEPASSSSNSDITSS